MPIWLQAAVIALSLVVAWTLAERSAHNWRPLRLRPRTPALPSLKMWAPRLALLLVLMATIHAAIDPHYDRRVFPIGPAELQHMAYAFGVTLMLMLGFPTLRTAAAGGWVLAAGVAVELLQAAALLPGYASLTDMAADAAGVAAAIVPMMIANIRAKRRAELTAPRGPQGPAPRPRRLQVVRPSPDSPA